MNEHLIQCLELLFVQICLLINYLPLYSQTKKTIFAHIVKITCLFALKKNI